MSGRAVSVLQAVDAVAGYTTYIDLIRPLISEKQAIISTGMKKEKERVHEAIRTARAGRSCALVSSGDPGIYAMAGLVLEICRDNAIDLLSHASAGAEQTNGKALYFEIVPGIPALCAGASLLGAPLMHDFAAISLSDLLTPWDTIESRLKAAAESDFVIVLYNPKSKRRKTHLERAQQIILRYRDKDTPVGIVKKAMRSGEAVRIVPLQDLHTAEVDMQTTVFVGNHTTRTYLKYMVTPRGYSSKYDLQAKESNKDTQPVDVRT
jgi:precorrin-3B C17-methyltransferase